MIKVIVLECVRRLRRRRSISLALSCLGAFAKLKACWHLFQDLRSLWGALSKLSVSVQLLWISKCFHAPAFIAIQSATLCLSLKILLPEGFQMPIRTIESMIWLIEDVVCARLWSPLRQICDFQPYEWSWPDLTWTHGADWFIFVLYIGLLLTM